MFVVCVCLVPGCVSEGDGVLCVELFSAGQNGDPDVCINDELVKQGLLELPSPTSRRHKVPRSQDFSLIIRPG